MYGYGDSDGPVFRASAGEFGRYGGRASLPFGATLRGSPAGAGEGWLRPPSIPPTPALRRSSRAGLAPLPPLAARPDGRSPHRHSRHPCIAGRTRRLVGQGPRPRPPPCRSQPRLLHRPVAKARGEAVRHDGDPCFGAACAAVPSLPTAACPGAATPFRRPCRNCKRTSHIRKRWHAHGNGVSVHMHPDV